MAKSNNTRKSRAARAKIYKANQRPSPFANLYKQTQPAISARALKRELARREEQRVKSRNKGESNGNSKLSRHDVELIRSLLDTGLLDGSEIAAKFEISESQVSKIKNYWQW